jgi:tubulin-specific chaperone A
MQRTRLQKEVSYYHKEIQENEARLADMKADTSKFDAYDIKRFQQVLDESYMMIPDSQRRYQQSLQDLKNYILELKDNVTDDDSTSSEAKKDALAGEWYEASQLLLEQQEQGHMNEAEPAPTTLQTNLDDLIEGEAF